MHSSYFVLKNKEGKQAEQLVKDYLTDRGYTVQDVSEEQDNYQNDIDFIVQKDGRTSKIEVKLDTRLAETQNIAFEDVSERQGISADRNTRGLLSLFTMRLPDFCKSC